MDSSNSSGCFKTRGEAQCSQRSLDLQTVKQSRQKAGISLEAFHVKLFFFGTSLSHYTLIITCVCHKMLGVFLNCDTAEVLS